MGTSTIYRCEACSQEYAKWQGRCPNCGEWNTLIEAEVVATPVWPTVSGKRSVGLAGGKTQAAMPLTSPSLSQAEDVSKRIVLPSAEFSNVLGWGIVPGSLILLAGEPGIGKSTLALQTADAFARDGRKTLYVALEESALQIRGRAERLGIRNENIELLCGGRFEDVYSTMQSHPADLVVFDSVSVASIESLSGSAGSMGQVRAIAETLLEWSKRTGKSCLLVGHITKDGTISGPKALEHLVDVVLSFEGERSDSYRLLRCFKNRFGSTDEVGLFTMEASGLVDLANPGLAFVSSAAQDRSGAAVGITLEGSRPLVVEVESLVVSTKFGYPKRSARGIAAGKLDILTAVLIKHADIRLDSSDVYVNVSRGLTLHDTATDLAAAAAIISSKRGIALGNSVFIGEVSLTGVVRTVAALGKRVEEAKKLGYTRIFIPKTPEKVSGDDANVIAIGTVSELAAQLLT